MASGTQPRKLGNPVSQHEVPQSGAEGERRGGAAVEGQEPVGDVSKWQEEGAVPGRRKDESEGDREAAGRDVEGEHGKGGESPGKHVVARNAKQHDMLKFAQGKLSKRRLLEKAALRNVRGAGWGSKRK